MNPPTSQLDLISPFLSFPMTDVKFGHLETGDTMEEHSGVGGNIISMRYRSPAKHTISAIHSKLVHHFIKLVIGR